MADALDSAIEKVRKLDPEQREELADLIEEYVGRVARRTQPLTPSERELVLQGLADFDQGHVASKDDVEAAYKVHLEP